MEANTIDYSSAANSFINFTGHGTFDFTPSADSFMITSGAATGLYGSMTGVYTIGNITTVGLDSSAPVTGSGLFEITDAQGDVFSANLTWVNINQLGTGGYLNTVGTVNLTDISYSGSNSALLALADDGSGIDVLSFQFIPAVSLASLKDSQHDTSFSGSLTGIPQPAPSPDGGSTVALLGAATLMIGCARRKLRR